MNILYFFAEDETYMTQWQRIHIFDELSHYEHSIDIYNPLHYRNVMEANEKLQAFLKNSTKKFDLFMTCVGSDTIYKDTIEDIKKLGLPTLLICFDNLHAPYMHKKIASSFDSVWLTSKETMGMFEKWGCKNIIFQPYAANPYNFNPHWDVPIHSVSFIGTPYGSRVNKLNLLTKSGIECNVYADSLLNIKCTSNSTPFTNKLNVSVLKNEISNAISFSIGRKLLYSALINKYLLKRYSELERNESLNAQSSVTFEDMKKIYSNSDLSLNIIELRNTYILKKPIYKIHLRTFEIPMCGGLELSSYTEELSNYFEDGKEIVLYNTHEELISKANFYLNPKNKKYCFEMKKNARKRAEVDHTWMNRFNVVFNNLSIH